MPLATPDGSPNDTYRLQRIESDIAEIKATTMSMQASVASLQLGLTDRFTSKDESRQYRRDFEDRLKDLKDETTRRSDETQKRVDVWEARFWMAAVTLFGTLVTAIVGLLRTLPPPH